MEDGMIEEVVGCREPLGEGLYNMWLTDERITRCRDCKYVQKSDLSAFYSDHEHDHLMCGLRKLEEVFDDEFCSRGEPKEEA